jgi:branched-chain amino acid aminotransferase
MQQYLNDIVFNNGRFVKASKASATLYSQSLHYGVAVIDGLRAYETNQGKQIFKPKEHFERFIRSAQKMAIHIPYSVEELIQFSYRLLELNDISSAYIRPLAYVGTSMELETSQEVNVMIMTWIWENYRGSDALDVMVSSYRRLHPQTVLIDAKVSGNYVNSVLAMNEAKSKGFDAAILLDNSGFVAEGAGSNFFYEKDGILFTPPAGNILRGITRATVFELAKEMGVKVVEKLFLPQILEEADAAFFSGTASEISRIKSVHHKAFEKKWEDTIACAIQARYRQRVVLGEYHSYSII